MNEVIWYVPADLLRTSIEIMRPHGARGNEGLALWLGTNDEAQRVTVTHVIEVHGPGFFAAPLQMRLSLNAMGQLTDLAGRLGRYLVGQIHSHPGDFTDLSDVDKDLGIRIPDYLSAVCPHYAQQPNTRLGDCGMHVFENNRYRRLSSSETSRRVIEIAEPVGLVRAEVSHD